MSKSVPVVSPSIEIEIEIEIVIVTVTVSGATIAKGPNTGTMTDIAGP